MKPNACPWCDSTAVLSQDEPEIGDVTYHFVECESCGAQGPMVDSKGKPLTQNGAIERWNEVAP